LEGSGGDPEPEKPVALQRCARFAHKKWYIESSAKEWGFTTKHFQATPSPLRYHDNMGVYGALVVLVKQGSNARPTD